jgi:hypothetical protein
MPELYSFTLEVQMEADSVGNAQKLASFVRDEMATVHPVFSFVQLTPPVPVEVPDAEPDYPAFLGSRTRCIRRRSRSRSAR